jgi:hypothetical protein
MVKGNNTKGHRHFKGIKTTKDHDGGHEYVGGLCLRSTQDRGHMSCCHLQGTQIIVNCKLP